MIKIFKYSVIWILLSNQKTRKQCTVGYQGKIIFFYIENKWDHEKMKETCHKQKIMHGLISMYTVYREYLLLFYFRPLCQQANFMMGKFQCLKLSIFKHNYIWANSRPGKTLCKERRAKITVYSIFRLDFRWTCFDGQFFYNFRRKSRMASWGAEAGCVLAM